MGAPIVGRIVSGGFDVVAWDPQVARVTSAGATLARSADDAVASAAFLLTILPGTSELEPVATRAIEVLTPGSIWIDLTSSDPRMVAPIAGRARERGIAAIGAPMGGGVTAARNGTLRFFAGGTPAELDRARVILDLLGSIDEIGPHVEDGYSAKLLTNLLWFGQAVAVTEALLLGQALGLEPALLRRSLATGAGGSVFIDEYLDRLLDGDYLTGFGIDRCVEELDTIASLARDSRVPFELSNLVARLHREALERFGGLDGELSVARLLEERAGRTLRN
jgi:3-hydroxyisobutyrate dehydrogenase-like beta-hydroxyacid dehydrogenase